MNELSFSTFVKADGSSFEPSLVAAMMTVAYSLPAVSVTTE